MLNAPSLVFDEEVGWGPGLQDATLAHEPDGVRVGRLLHVVCGQQDGSARGGQHPSEKTDTNILVRGGYRELWIIKEIMLLKSN